MNSIFSGFRQRTNNNILHSFLKGAPVATPPPIHPTRYLLTRPLHLFVVLAFVLTLSACGGGGGGGAKTYTVGGTVSGLDGTLVLQNNSGDDKTITADEAFTFATSVAYLSSYSVTVSSQPTGQFCTVSGGSGTMGTANVTNVAVSCVAVSVGALYSTNGADWNDYVKNDGADVYNANDLAADGSETGGYSAVIHGGEMRSVEVPDYSACGDLAATDALGAFDWTCDGSTDPVRMVSTGLADDKNLSDLLDFTTPGWLSNSVTVTGTGAGLPFTTASSATWWSNTVTEDNDGIASGAVAGTVYIVTTDPTAVYVIDASNVALVIKPGVTMSGPGTNVYVIDASSQNFLWIEGTIDATGDHTGIHWEGVKFSVLRNVEASNANEDGVYLGNSQNNSLSNITAANNGDDGFYSEYLDNSSLSNITASNNGQYGVFLTDSDNNSLSNITGSNNGQDGVHLNWALNNSLSNITAANNGDDGVHLNFSDDNGLSNITAANNVNYGVYIGGSDNTSLSNITAANNVFGVRLDGSSNNSLSNITAANNEYGVLLNTSSNNNSLSNITAANNGDVGVLLSNSSDNYFTGLLKVGDNVSGSDCSDNNSTTFSDIICTKVSPSDFALTTSVTLASSFVGKVTSDDTANTSDSTGTATYATSLDWTSFENPYRVWGKDGSAFPNSDHMGRWTTGTGRIWDWSADTGDTVITGVLSALLVGDAANTITHTWVDSSTVTYLRNASEIMGDDIGNDNGLCETDETCLYTPNIGSYQGHGTLESAGTWSDEGDDTITGVTLMQYPTNGY